MCSLNICNKSLEGYLDYLKFTQSLSLLFKKYYLINSMWPCKSINGGGGGGGGGGFD